MHMVGQAIYDEVIMESLQYVSRSEECITILHEMLCLASCSESLCSDVFLENAGHYHTNVRSNSSVYGCALKKNVFPLQLIMTHKVRHELFVSFSPGISRNISPCFRKDTSLAAVSH